MVDKVLGVVYRSEVNADSVSKVQRDNPSNAYELVAYLLTKGNNGSPLKLDKADFKRETGITIGDLSERMISERDGGHYEGEYFEDEYAKEIAVDFFSKVNSNNDIKYFIRRNRKAENAERADYFNGQIAKEINDRFGMSVDEYNAMAEELRKKILLQYLETGEDISKLAEQGIKENERVSEEETGRILEPEQGAESDGNTEGGEVLPGEQADTGNNVEESNGSTEGDNGNDVLLVGNEAGEVESTDTKEPAVKNPESANVEKHDDKRPVDNTNDNKVSKSAASNKTPHTREEAVAYFDEKFGAGSESSKKALRIWELTNKSKLKSKQSKLSDSLVSPKKNELFNQEEQDIEITEEEKREIQLLGIELGAEYVNSGILKFADFFTEMVNTFGDGIRPFTKRFYLGITATVSDDIVDQMDDIKAVRAFDENKDIYTQENESDNLLQQPEPGIYNAGSSDTEAGGGDTGTEENDGRDADRGHTGGDRDSGGIVSDVQPGNSEREGSSSEGKPEETGGTNSGGRSGSNRGGRVGGQSNGGERTGEKPGNDTESEGKGNVGLEAPTAEEISAAEQESYESTKESIKEEADTNALKKRKDNLKDEISKISADNQIEKANKEGEQRAVLERLRELFANSDIKQTDLSSEKTEYIPASDPEGKHSIGSVVPTGSSDDMKNAIANLEKEVGMSIAVFVKEELGYKSADEMFSDTANGKDTGLSSEQVDSVGLAISQMKKKKMFIVGDMTGVGKGRQGAAIIRWAKRNNKKVLFVTAKSDLFSCTYTL